MSELANTEHLAGAAARMDEVTHGGMASLARLSDAEFEHRLELVRKWGDRVNRIHKELMIPGQDYGLIPGTQKPTLLQPGSEKLMLFYQLAAEFRLEIIEGDGVTKPPISVKSVCLLHLGNQDGPVVGEGVGECNSWERKYRYRIGERECPDCSKAGCLTKSKRDNGWFCWTKKGGCGAEFTQRDPRIVEQVAGMVDNPDPYDLKNTLAKMAAKRSQVDATKRVTGTSGLYTQDIEDMADYADRVTEPAADESPREQPRTEAPHGQPRTASAPRTDRPRAPESSGDRAATNGGKCSDCNAPAGKPHTRNCPTRQVEQPASTPAASEPKPPAAPSEPAPTADDEAQRRQEVDTLRAVWRSCDGPEDEAAMKHVCAAILTQALGTPTKVMSITLMPAEWARICHESLFQDGIPHVSE